MDHHPSAVQYDAGPPVPVADHPHRIPSTYLDVAPGPLAAPAQRPPEAGYIPMTEASSLATPSHQRAVAFEPDGRSSVDPWPSSLSAPL
jgi:hypothetical protein